MFCDWFAFSSSLFSEGKVEAHEVAAEALVPATRGQSFEIFCGELLVPSQTIAAMHKGVVAVTDGKYVHITEIGWITRQHLPGDSHQLVSTDDEELR